MRSSRSVLRRGSCAAVFAAHAALAAGCAAPPARAPQRPDVVVILVDDLGWRDIGCMGQDVASTPRIDALAAQGMKFTQAYAANPVCSPTRAALMAGKYPARVDINDWIPGTPFPRARMLPPPDRDELPLAEVTLAEALRARGYATWHVGKWHLGGQGFLPQDQGFAVNWLGSHLGHPASHFFPFDGGDPQHSHVVRNLPPGARDGDWLGDLQARAAADLIRTAPAGQPFFLYLPFYAVHAPIEAKPGDVERHRQLAAAHGQGRDKKPRPAFAAMLENLDAAVGTVLDALEASGRARNTVVVFTSDNGGLASVSENAPLRGGKRSLWEGGIRVPLLVRWPGTVAAGSVCALPTITQDLHRTLCAAAGAPIDDAVAADAFDLGPALRGERPGPRGPLFWHFPQHETRQVGPRGAVRDGDWKLIEDFASGQVLLFDLARDGGETNDLAATEPERAQALLARLRAWRQQVGAKMPAPNPDFAGDGS